MIDEIQRLPGARELGSHFDLARALHRGLLPSSFSDDPKADLQAYCGAYLQQEIVAEGATRNVPAFSRFLRVAAQCDGNGTVVNFTAVANDAHRVVAPLDDVILKQQSAAAIFSPGAMPVSRGTDSRGGGRLLAEARAAASVRGHGD